MLKDLAMVVLGAFAWLALMAIVGFHFGVVFAIAYNVAGWFL